MILFIHQHWLYLFLWGSPLQLQSPVDFFNSGFLFSGNVLKVFSKITVLAAPVSNVKFTRSPLIIPVRWTLSFIRLKFSPDAFLFLSKFLFIWWSDETLFRVSARPAESTLSSLTTDQKSHSSLQFPVPHWYFMKFYFRHWGPHWCYSRWLGTILFCGQTSAKSQVSEFETSSVVYTWLFGAILDWFVLTTNH